MLSRRTARASGFSYLLSIVSCSTCPCEIIAIYPLLILKFPTHSAVPAYLNWEYSPHPELPPCQWYIKMWPSWPHDKTLSIYSNFVVWIGPLGIWCHGIEYEKKNWQNWLQKMARFSSIKVNSILINSSNTVGIKVQFGKCAKTLKKTDQCFNNTRNTFLVTTVIYRLKRFKKETGIGCCSYLSSGKSKMCPF